MAQWRAKVKYERPTQATRLDRLQDAVMHELRPACNRLADQVIATAQAELSSFTTDDLDLLEAAETFRESLHREDAGKNFKRKKKGRGSERLVTLVTTRPGAALSGPLLEYGKGNAPALKPLGKAVFKLGGTVY